jgi:flagellar biosynthesis component FlhA
MIDLQMTAKRIAEARAEAGFTQQELAERLGVTMQAVSKWERAQSLPDIELLLDFRRILGISPEYLLTGASGEDESARAWTQYHGAAEAVLKQLNYHAIELMMSTAFVEAHGEEIFGNKERPLYVIERIKDFRIETMRETGVLLPMIRLRDMDEKTMPPNSVRLVLRGKAVFEEEITGEPVEGFDQAVGRALPTIRKYLPIFVNRHMVKMLVERLREELPFCVEGVIPERVSLSRLTRALREIVRQGVSAYDLQTVIETLDDAHDNSLSEEEAIQETMKALA